MSENWKKISIAAVLGLMGLTSGAVYDYYQHVNVPQHTLSIGGRGVSLKQFSIDPSRIEARAAVVYDPISGKILYQKNAQMQLPLASLTKLAAARAVLSSAGRDQMVIISGE